MYLNYYNLEKEPFHITPDPEFLFLSPSHKEALAAIMYGVEQRKGFIAITGEVGVGKTTVLRSYLEQIDRKKLITIYIFNPNLSFRGLLKTVFVELGLQTETEDTSEMINQLYQILIVFYKHGRNVTLVIDEAQNMPMETLENLRMLSNLETSKDKLIQIVFVGQPEFGEMLERKELRQLTQRIAIRATISPFTREECMAYIQHRLTKASLHRSTIFTRRALKKIIAQSHGIPRITNILCDNALITGFGYQQERITSDIAKEVIADFKGTRASASVKWVFAAVTLLLVAGIFSAFLYRNNLLPRSEVVPNFSAQEAQPSQKAKNTGSLQAGQVAGTALTGSSANPHEETKPVTPDSIPHPAILEDKKEPSSVIRSVRKGDNLFNLVREVYGHRDDNLIKLVIENNPGITSSDKIRIGDEIIFPAHNPSREDK